MFFIENISECLPLASQLLGSKVNSDVIEALEFLAVAQEFNIACSRESIRKALVLVWSSEQTVRELVMKVYIRLYLSPLQDSPPQSRYSLIVRNLLSLVKDASLGEMASLEEMIMLLMKNDDLPKQVLGILWDMFTGKVVGSSPTNSKLALMLVTMAARENQDVVRSNLQLLLEYGLKRDDLVLSRLTCTALQRLSKSHHRLTSSHEIFVKLGNLLVDTYASLSSSNWCPLTEQAVVTIYLLSEQPDSILENIIKRICSHLFSEEGVTPSQYENELISSSFGCDIPDPSLALSRLFFLLGHVAKQQLVHIEVSISKELKRRRNKENGGSTSTKKKKETEVNDNVITCTCTPVHIYTCTYMC